MDKKTITAGEEAYKKEKVFFSKLTFVKRDKNRFIVTEMEALSDVYNDMLRGLVKLKINEQILSGICIIHPEDKALLEKLAVVKTDIEVNEKALTILREKIAERSLLKKNDQNN